MKIKVLVKLAIVCLILTGLSGISQAIAIGIIVDVTGPEYHVEWLPPLINKDKFNDGSTIPVKFKLMDTDGNFAIDYATTVDIIGPGTTLHYVYGEGDDNIRIDADEEYYIVNFHSTSDNIGGYVAIVTVEGNSPENNEITFQIV